MRTERFVVRDVGIGARRDGFRVEGGEMIPLEIPVEGDFPIGAFDGPRAQERPARQTRRLEILEHGAVEFLDVDCRARREYGEYHAGGLAARQLGEPPSGFVEFAVLVLLRHREQATIVAVRPTVVHAGEAGALTVAFGGDRSTAVRTNVEKDMGLSRL